MDYKFCTIQKLHPSTRRCILSKMVYADGTMKDWIRARLPYRLCLVYVGRRLVTWVCLIDTSPYSNDSYTIAAWTLQEYRRQGYARAGTRALLSRHRVTKKNIVFGFSDEMLSLIKSLGYDIPIGCIQDLAKAHMMTKA